MPRPGLTATTALPGVVAVEGDGVVEHPAKDARHTADKVRFRNRLHKIIMMV